MRASNRSLAVYRGLDSKKLLSQSFWNISTPYTRTNKQEKTIDSNTTLSPRTSEYPKLLAFIDSDGDTVNEQQDLGLRHRDLAQSFRNTPIFTAAVDKFVHSELPPSEQNLNLVPQYGLIGTRRDGRAVTSLEDGLVIGNVNVPWSAFICGSQGAGKSHTLSCLLENALVAQNNAGALPYPLAGMVMHYDSYANYNTAHVCEAAYLCSAGIPVNVLVSPSNIWAMKRLYNNLPGLAPDSPKPKVVPLYLEEHQLDASRILKLMAVDPTTDKPPLYMEIVMDIVREIAMEGSAFTYSKFRGRIADMSWMSGQKIPLNLRLQLLDSFMAPSSMTKSTRPARSSEDIWAFEPGSLTIVDLSDPFIGSDEACTLFSICLSIFLEERNKCGRIVALDEAHKFLAQSGEALVLTNELVSVIRQQRHTGTRVVIATQEPTLSPKLIDLANATFVHRFLSPSWYEVLKNHLAGANTQDPGTNNSLFRTIVGLRTGQALLFCPTARMDVDDEAPGGTKWIKPLNDSYINIQIRRRLTADGGKSIMATIASESPKTLVDIDVPMHIVEPMTKDDKKDKKKKGKSKAPEKPNEPTTQSISSADKKAIEINEELEGIPRYIIVEEGKRHASYMVQNHGWVSFTASKKKTKHKFFRDLEKLLNMTPGTITNDKVARRLITETADIHIVRVSQ
ncbi:hypothetical protein GL218_04120 [Daldinia childiae]|uniref:uncharacterized protein n=1 Tax=Daldinia childiae TaxID=326645 RepID=UPI001448291A|nr:uncharacterized protein GL218_04120 [Daldinia childiae]KAF3061101.1 hypothetical protein GL218_04120 [Daldinia childiae]